MQIKRVWTQHKGRAWVLQERVDVEVRHQTWTGHPVNNVGIPTHKHTGQPRDAGRPKRTSNPPPATRTQPHHCRDHRRLSHHREATTAFSSCPSIHLPGLTQTVVCILGGMPPEYKPCPDHACASTPVACEFGMGANGEPLAAWEQARRGTGKASEFPTPSACNGRKAHTCTNAHTRTCNAAVSTMDASPGLAGPTSNSERGGTGHSRQDSCVVTRPLKATARGAQGPKQRQLQVPERKEVRTKDKKHRIFN